MTDAKQSRLVPIPDKEAERLEEIRTRIMLGLASDMGDNVDPASLLALMAYVTGQVAALQDDKRITREQVNQMVSANIKQGNLDMQQKVKSAKAKGELR